MLDTVTSIESGASSTTGHKVVIAGGGVAALETMLALRELAQDRVELELLTPNSEFVYRPMEVAALFRDDRVQRFDLARIAADQGANLVCDRLEGVWPDNRLVTQSGDVRAYDSLVIAVGTHLRMAIPGAITLGAPGFKHDLLRALEDIEAGIARKLAFVAPASVGWLLPLYELALMAADRLTERGAEADLTIVTPEEAPLEVFGPEASAEVDRVLRDRGISLVVRRRAVSADANGLVVDRADRLDVDRVLALPAMSGPRIRGVPETVGGFIPTDRHGQVIDTPGVFAAGDGTAFPVKQGGLAAQQADAVAEAVAARAGADVEPRPFAPVLRGLLLTGAEPHYLRHDLARPGTASETSERPLWWPAAKVAARNLAPYLAARPGLELRTNGVR